MSRDEEYRHNMSRLLASLARRAAAPSPPRPPASAVGTARGPCGRAYTGAVVRARAASREENDINVGEVAATFVPGTHALTDVASTTLAAMLDARTLGRVTLTGAAKDAEYRRVEFRAVTIRGATALQRTRYDARQAFTSNHAYDGGSSGENANDGKDSKLSSTSSAREAIEEALGSGYKHWRVERASGAWSVTVNVKKQRATVSRDKTMRLIDGEAKTSVVIGPQSHDREKARLLDGSDPFLKHVGVAAADGSIKTSKRDKYKQVEEFLKILDHAYDDATGAGHMVRGSTARPLRMVDLGCGNAYLTFGAYTLLANKRDVPTHVIGVDIKRQAREHNTAVAVELGWDDCMCFVEGSIAKADVKFVKGNDDAAADIVLALHACDTATDEAIVRTVRWSSPLALIAPCCHHDLQVRLKNASIIAFPPITRHGILSERFGDVLTDSFRAHILRLLGYRVEVMEFVGGEHTPRNTLIRAIRTGSPASKSAWEEYDAMRETWGVTPWLADALADELNKARAGVFPNSDV
jgi:SAM-dependent methyltransferase